MWNGNVGGFNFHTPAVGWGGGGGCDIRENTDNPCFKKELGHLSSTASAMPPSGQNPRVKVKCPEAIYTLRRTPTPQSQLYFYLFQLKLTTNHYLL